MNVLNITTNFTDALEQSLLSKKISFFTYHRGEDLNAERLELQSELKGKDKSLLLVFTYHISDKTLTFRIDKQVGELSPIDIKNIEDCLAQHNAEFLKHFN